MTTIRNDKSRRKGISNLVGIGIAIGATVAIGFGFFATMGDSLDSMTGSNRIAIESLTAYTSGDRLVITGNVKNLGNQPLDSLLIDEITAGDLVITQNNAFDDGSIIDGHGDISMSWLDNGGNEIRTNGAIPILYLGSGVTTSNPTGGLAIPAGAAMTPNTFYIAHNGTTTPTGLAGVLTAGANAKVELVSGLSGSATALSGLSTSQAFRIIITGISSGGAPGVLDVKETVPAQTQLFMTVAGTDGSTTTISDPRSVRVTAR